MGTMNIRRSLVSVAIAAAFGVAGGPAGAVVYAGEFDPDDFSGTFTITVDDDCFTGGNAFNGFHSNAGIAFNPNDGICTAALTSASALVSQTTPAFNGSLTFAPPVISNPSVLLGISVTGVDPYTLLGGTLDSLDTALIHHVGATPATAADWWIQFRSGQVSLCYPNCYLLADANVDLAPAGAPNSLPRGVYLYDGPNPIPGEFTQSAQYLNIRVVPPAQVPEPGTLGLILGALGGGWLARRRKKPKSAD